MPTLQPSPTPIRKYPIVRTYVTHPPTPSQRLEKHSHETERDGDEVGIDAEEAVVAAGHDWGLGCWFRGINGSRGGADGEERFVDVGWLYVERRKVVF